ncbi:MAG: hypothetical protein HC903_27725 [Methylacidiphilales bacterium]|nr:hypothetical protein [Candidatus Methylacidiphilales bacterium]
MSLTNPNSNIIVVSGFDFTAALNEKADVVHQHQIVNVENLQTTLDEKASVDHEHQIEQIVGLSTALYNKASTEALNLKYNDLVDLIFSVSVYSKETPDVQFYGQIWHELNASNDILESWVFADIPTLGSRWISTTTYENILCWFIFN